MAVSTDNPLPSPYKRILAWSRGTTSTGTAACPIWQRDALRRIVLNGQLDKADLDELEVICQASNGIKAPAGSGVQAVPLSETHIPAGPDATSSVSLLKLGALKNVNRLAQNTTLEFGPAPGLTIIFGDNGTGKSGYARVLKKACRARGAAQPIKPNALDPKARGPASATIVCSVGSVETPIQWTDGSPSDPRLGNVFVFDSASARVHISDDAPAIFTPRGLDVLPKLARACDELKYRLKKQIEDITGRIAQRRMSWKFHATTEVAALLHDLNGYTKTEKVEAVAAFSPNYSPPPT